MKVRNILFYILVCSFFLVPNHNVNASDQPIKNWEAFSKNLIMALKSSNEGLQRSAMQQIIVYADQLNVKKGVLELSRIYSNHEDDGVRRLAMMAMYKIDRKWAVEYLRKNIKFEKSGKLKKDIFAMIEKYDRDLALQSALSSQ